MNTTQLLSDYIRGRGFSQKAISNATGIPTSILYPSLARTVRRPLRADEFLAICIYLQVDPMSFYPTEEKATIEPQVAAS